MEEKKKIVVVAKVGGIEIIVEGEKDEDVYELTLSKSQATHLALDILNTVYKAGERIQTTMLEDMASQIYHLITFIYNS